MHLQYKEEFGKFKRLNPEIVAYRNRRWRTLFIKIFLLEAVIAAMTFFAYDRYSVSAIPVGVLLAVLLPFPIFKAHKYFRQKWIGKVENIEYLTRRVQTNGNPADRSYTSMTTKNFIRCYTDNKHFFMLDQKYEIVYHVGDTVMTVSGLDYPINLTGHENTVCPKCGTILRESNEECVGSCGMPITKFTENIRQKY